MAVRRLRLVRPHRGLGLAGHRRPVVRRARRSGDRAGPARAPSGSPRLRVDRDAAGGALRGAGRRRGGRRGRADLEAAASVAGGWIEAQQCERAVLGLDRDGGRPAVVLVDPDQAGFVHVVPEGGREAPAPSPDSDRHLVVAVLVGDVEQGKALDLLTDDFVAHDLDADLEVLAVLEAGCELVEVPRPFRTSDLIALAGFRYGADGQETSSLCAAWCDRPGGGPVKAPACAARGAAYSGAENGRRHHR